MKNRLLFLLLVSTYSLSAQLTKGQVYDFEPGDVLQVTYAGGYTGPKPVQTDTITGKTVSVTSDTITYTIKRLIYTAGYQGSQPSYQESVIIFQVNNVNDPAQHYSVSSCLAPLDTMITGSCGESVWHLESVYDASCFEPPFMSSDLYAGLGGPYVYDYDPSDGNPMSWISSELTYYNTSEHGECGIPKLYVGLQEMQGVSFSVYPNPANEKITLESGRNGWDYSITTLSGVKALSGTTADGTAEVIVSGLPEGYYLIYLVHDGQASLPKPFVKL